MWNKIDKKTSKSFTFVGVKYYLISKGKGIIVIQAELTEKFKELLISYYEGKREMLYENITIKECAEAHSFKCSIEQIFLELTFCHSVLHNFSALCGYWFQQMKQAPTKCVNLQRLTARGRQNWGREVLSWCW